MCSVRVDDVDVVTSGGVVAWVIEQIVSLYQEEIKKTLRSEVSQVYFEIKCPHSVVRFRSSGG